MRLHISTEYVKIAKERVGMYDKEELAEEARRAEKENESFQMSLDFAPIIVYNQNA